MTGGGIEIRFRVGEGNFRLLVPILSHQVKYEAGMKGGIGKAVEEARPRRNAARLMPQMRTARIIGADQRPVPAPQRAILQRDMAVVIRRIVEQDRQESRIGIRILGQKLEQAFFRVTGTEGYARRSGRSFFRGTPVKIDRLFEQRDAGFVPQAFAEKKRRVDRRRQHRRGGHDGGLK